MSRAVLITGATGKQGGAVVKALLSAGSDYKVLGVTRDATSASAKRLASLSPQISIVEGNLDDTDSLFTKAREINQGPVWGVFSIQSPGMTKDGPANEERQGKALVDSAIKHGVKQFVYSSVDRHGERSVNNPTNIPHFISKHNIEHHLIDNSRNTGMTWTILRPVAFMENFVDGFIGKVFGTTWKMMIKSRPLQLVAVDDIGVFGAKALLENEKYQGKAISLAGDELTFEQMDKVFQEVTGSGAPLTFEMLAWPIVWMSKELNAMFNFFEKEGYAADIGEVRKAHPGLKTLGMWLADKRSK